MGSLNPRAIVIPRPVVITGLLGSVHRLLCNHLLASHEQDGPLRRSSIHFYRNGHDGGDPERNQKPTQFLSLCNIDHISLQNSRIFLRGAYSSRRSHKNMNGSIFVRAVTFRNGRNEARSGQYELLEHTYSYAICLPESGRAAFLKSFGRRQAYESPGSPNPRASTGALSGFRLQPD